MAPIHKSQHFTVLTIVSCTLITAAGLFYYNKRQKKKEEAHKNRTSFSLSPTVTLHVAQQSVVDFSSPASAAGGGGGFGGTGGASSVGNSEKNAIVNAANQVCLGGGGVDGAITRAGGPNLAQDREDLPVVDADGMPVLEGDIRCPTGHAVVTGPNDYGSLQVPYVIHAVGPNYSDFAFGNYNIPDRLLRSAYQSSLDRCLEHDITNVAFSLLSAGIYRGQRKVQDVLTIGILAIRDWAVLHNHKKNDDKDEVVVGPLQSITLCGFSENEANLLLEICRSEL